MKNSQRSYRYRLIKRRALTISLTLIILLVVIFVFNSEEGNSKSSEDENINTERVDCTSCTEDDFNQSDSPKSEDANKNESEINKLPSKTESNNSQSLSRNISNQDNNQQHKVEQKSTHREESISQNKDDVTYINGILIANKTYALPASYNPGVNPEAKKALDNMIQQASSQGISLWVISGFRSYQTQKNLYENYVRRDGKAAADTYSARPGHSEHQTGLAFDLNSVSDDFANTKEAAWLAEHCHEYGFIIRYPKNKENVTGYQYEAWHIRYLGEEIAKKVKSSGLCLEEYLGIDSKYKN